MTIYFNTNKLIKLRELGLSVLITFSVEKKNSPHVSIRHREAKQQFNEQQDIRPLLQDIRPLLQDIRPLLQDIKPLLRI